MSCPTPRRAPQIHHLVVAFYREIVFDDVLGPFFDEVAEVDWTVHIPRLIDYWCRILLGEPGYDGYLLGAHREVHHRAGFSDDHFAALVPALRDHRRRSLVRADRRAGQSARRGDCAVAVRDASATSTGRSRSRQRRWPRSVLTCDDHEPSDGGFFIVLDREPAR